MRAAPAPRESGRRQWVVAHLKGQAGLARGAAFMVLCEWARISRCERSTPTLRVASRWFCRSGCVLRFGRRIFWRRGRRGGLVFLPPGFQRTCIEIFRVEAGHLLKLNVASFTTSRLPSILTALTRASPFHGMAHAEEVRGLHADLHGCFPVLRSLMSWSSFAGCP